LFPKSCKLVKYFFSQSVFKDHAWVSVKLQGSDSLLIGFIYHSPSSPSRIFGRGANLKQGSGGMPHAQENLKEDAKILQFRDISTHYTTLKIRYSSCVNGEVLVGSGIHVIIAYTLTISAENSRVGIWRVYS